MLVVVRVGWLDRFRMFCSGPTKDHHQAAGMPYLQLRTMFVKGAFSLRIQLCFPGQSVHARALGCFAMPAIASLEKGSGIGELARLRPSVTA